MCQCRFRFLLSNLKTVYEEVTGSYRYGVKSQKYLLCKTTAINRQCMRVILATTNTSSAITGVLVIMSNIMVLVESIKRCLKHIHVSPYSLTTATSKYTWKRCRMKSFCRRKFKVLRISSVEISSN